MAQQKQRKQLILTDNQNISNYHFQPIQRLQLNFITDGIKNFVSDMVRGTETGLRHHMSSYVMALVLIFLGILPIFIIVS